MRRSTIDNNLEKLDELEFTILDTLNDIVFIRPIFLLFRSTSLVKHHETYNSLKRDLLEKL